MKVVNDRVMPTPTPREQAVPGQVYLYRRGKRDCYVVPVRDSAVFGPGVVWFVALETGEVWSGDAGLLYEVDAELRVKESF